MKKLFAVVALLCFILSLVPQTQAIETWTLRDDMMYYEGGEEFVERVDALLPEVPVGLLISLENRILSLTGLSEIDELSRMKLHYLNQEVGKTLHLQAQNTELTQNEKDTIEAEILKIQQSFLEGLEKNINLLIQEVSSSIGTREIGGMSGDFYYNIPYLGEMTLSFKMDEYIADTQSLDSGRLRGSFQISLNIGEEKISSNFDLDLIIQGNDIYLLIENLEVEANEEVLIGSRQMIEVIQAFGKTKTYIHIGDTYGDMTYDFGNILSLSDITSQKWYSALSTQALLTPKGKIGNTYFLSPHAEMCHLGKALMSVFDPFSGGKCSEKQFESFSQDMQDILDIRYTQRGQTGIFEFGLKNQTIALGSSFIVHIRNSLFHNMTWDISDVWGEEHFSGNYEANKELSFTYVSENTWSTTDIVGTLGLGKTGIDSINIQGRYNDEYIEIIGELNLKDTILSGTLTGENYHNDTLSCSFSGKIVPHILEMRGECLITDLGDELALVGKINIDMSENKNNLIIDFDARQDDISFINFQFQNIGSRKKDMNLIIPSPQKYMPIEELIEMFPIFSGYLSSGDTWNEEWDGKTGEKIEY